MTDPSPLDTHAANLLVQRTAWLRALSLWFHGAHHVVRGVSFSGDHTDLYEHIYREVADELDAAVEKTIGLTGDLNAGCPLVITMRAVGIMEEHPSPATLDPDSIAQAGLAMEQEYVSFVEYVFTELEESGEMSLGLNDQLGASANTHEGYIYLLQQRSTQ